MNPHVNHFAQRLAGAGDFLASALAEYTRSEGLDEAALAGRLGCSAETLTRLRLCRMPRASPPLFWRDVELIAQRFAVPVELLGEIVRRGQSLVHLRSATGKQQDAPDMLLAARDEEPGQETPEGGRS